jgi:hypothetical protein
MSVAVALQGQVHPTRPALLRHPPKDDPVVVDRVWELLDPDHKRAAFRMIVEVGCRLIRGAAVSATERGGNCDEYC